METVAEKYIKSPLKTLINVNGIYTIHYFKYGKNFRCRSEKHNFWEIVYIDSGEANIIANDKEFVLHQGEAYFHRPNEKHTIYTLNNFANSAIVSFECSSRAMNFFFDKILLFNEFERSLLNKIIFEGKNSFEDKLNDIYLLKMTKKLNAPFAGEQLIKNCVELLIISLIRNNENSAEAHKVENNVIHTGSDKIVDNIIKILSSHLYSTVNIDLETIADELSFSKTYIKAQFKKKLGTSIIQYYINLKIDEAKKLISQERYTMSEIADMLGFNSVYYFSRQFKLHTDMSPTEYAESIKADNVL